MKNFNSNMFGRMSFGCLLTVVFAFGAAQGAERNLAFRRAVYQSSAADYTQVGHLVTDGQYMDAEFGEAVATCDLSCGESPRGEEPACAIDGTTQSKWLIFRQRGTLHVKLPQAARAVRYVVASANDDPKRDPKAWRLFGRKDDGTFVELDRQSNVKFDRRHQRKAWDIPRPGLYRHYSLEILENSGDRGDKPGDRPRLQLSEFDVLDANGQSVIRPEGPDAFRSQWVSKGRDHEWLMVDLGAPSALSRVVIAWGKGGAAATSAVEVSSDGKAWKRVAQAKTGAELRDTLAVTARDVRYVKLVLDQAEKSRFAVTELEIWGDNDFKYELPPQPALGQADREPLTGGTWKLAPAREVTASGEALTAWAFDDSAWLPAVVPGTVVTSYRAAGAIPDMNLADNQLMISEGFFNDDFWYRKTFVPPARSAGERTWLNFDAVNWKAEVFFNGRLLGKIEGAFLRRRFDITKLVRPNEKNRLAVRIRRNATPGKATVQDRWSPGLNGGVLGLDNPTIHASIGWDWVPTVRGRNIGIYRDVTLSYTREVTLADGWAVTDLDVEKKDFSKSAVTLKTCVRNAGDHPVTATLTGAIAEAPEAGTLRLEVPLAAGESKEVTLGTLALKSPKLWWPATYGDQPLYTAKLQANVDGRVSQAQQFKFGVRKFTYKVDKPMTIFCNGTRIICRGGNWGMDEANLAATPLDYDTKVRLHAEANLNMIRNWVGMTNSEDFYNACDKYGVLIWDDFWLANPSDGPNPADPAMFLVNAADKIRKERRHAALALYCGRNEGNPPPSLYQALPKLVADLDGTRHYIPDSAANTVSGHGPYGVRNPKWYFENAPLTLHSERGQPNVPEIDSMRAMLGPDHLWPRDDVWGMHDFTEKGAQSCGDYCKYIDSAYMAPQNLEEFTRLAQLVAYENHKAMFESTYVKGGNGLLMWMSQSAWPSMVWQTYDYWHDVNGGYWGAKVGNQPVNVIFDASTDSFWAVNATAQHVKGVAKVAFYATDGKLLTKLEKDVDLASDTRRRVFELPKLEPADGMLLMRATMRVAGKPVAENFTWTNVREPRHYQALLPLLAGKLDIRDVRVERQGATATGKAKLVNNGSKPVLLARVKLVDGKGARIAPVHWSGNYVTLMPGENREVRFTATDCSAAVGELKVVQELTQFHKPGQLPDWAFGPFVRPAGANPVIRPNPQTTFDCPMRKRPIKWEESDTFNPAATVKDGKIVVLYRAEDNTAKGIGSRTSRLGYAETGDGVTFKHDAKPVLFPCEDSQKEFDWEGGCEDPRLAMTEDGLYVCTYTSWNRKVPRLCVATSRDLKHWTKHGPAFAKCEGGRYRNMASKSAAIVQAPSAADPSRYVITKINGQYWMYWGESAMEVATSDNLVDWTPRGKVMRTRPGYFDSALTEVGPAALLTPKGIVVFYNGKNSNGGTADPRYPRGVYCGGQALFKATAPQQFVTRLDVPYFKPEAPFEKTGQYKDGTVFTEGLVLYRGKWHLYYGCADSFVGCAIWNPSKR